ncbi:MAG: ACT domain-containing protein, partial [Clostridia bacterium]
EEYRKEHKEVNLEQKIEELSKEKVRQKPTSSGVIVKGIDNCLVKLSRCCNPVPGDEIVGYITKGRGVSVHRKDCKNVKDLVSEENRMIDVSWYTDKPSNYNVDIAILSNDRDGLLADIIATVTAEKTPMMSVNSKVSKERIVLTELTIEVSNVTQLNNVLKALRKVDSVYEVRRNK